MSLAVVIKGPEGVVLAADSSIRLEAQRPSVSPIVVNFDNATKLLSFRQRHNFVGAVTHSAAVIGSRTAHSFLPEIERDWENCERLTVEEYAKKLSTFFFDRWREVMPADYKGPDMYFIVGGYDPSDAYGKVFLFGIPRYPDPEPRNPGENDFGMTWGGQLEIASRLIHGFDPSLLDIIRQELNLDDKRLQALTESFQRHRTLPIPYAVLPLQDCIDLATFLIRTTMNFQNLAVGVRGVGGPIDVAVITRTKGLEYVQQKKIHGENE